MTNGPGYIQLQRALDSVHVGRRHRAELGDIDALAASIDEHGLFQIITIDPDGNLVCGLRRLVAMRKLGWKTADVWVRPGISDQLGQLLAEQDDNALHKPLTLTEQATLYRELKTLMAEDAARRQEASRFQAGGARAGMDGGATVAPPSAPEEQGGGKSRAQAALMVTGRNSYTSLERIGELQRLTADETQPAAVRERAAAELEGIDAGGAGRDRAAGYRGADPGFGAGTPGRRRAGSRPPGQEARQAPPFRLVHGRARGGDDGASVRADLGRAGAVVGTRRPGRDRSGAD